MDIIRTLAQDLGVHPYQIAATVDLFDTGSTVPFVARYRKEATGGLDDTQLRTLHERLTYLRELDARRETVLKTIEEQGKLTPELKRQIEAVDNKQALEDLYLPYRPKRRTKAQIAREQGLEPLADQLLKDPTRNPEQVAKGFITSEIADAETALKGARAILMERFSEDAPLIATLRKDLWKVGYIKAGRASKEETPEVDKFRDYFDHDEAIQSIPSHRALALLRGRNEKILSLGLCLGSATDEAKQQANEKRFIGKIATAFGIADKKRPGDRWLMETVSLAWRAKIGVSLELEAINRMKEEADKDAIEVFARNAKDLLLAAPAGRVAAMGLDPGIRTGVKVAVVDDTGKLLETATIFPHAPRHDWNGSKKTLTNLIKKHKIGLIAIGNGTASRETDTLAGEVVKEVKEKEKGKLHKVVVSESGASVYSASELAAAEFPDLDVSLRGAVSIARRLQDPLAELVKIDPKSIGVGQYQHDVNQGQLAKTLTDVVEDCVNAVGVNVNTASAPLLAYVSGLNSTLAKNIVQYRDENGAFQSRKALLKVPRMGPKTFEQSAGFLRVQKGSEPLDASAVHPEAYTVVKQMLAKHPSGPLKAADLIGNSDRVRELDPKAFVTPVFGLPTIRDILEELEKPGRDPRGSFKTATFASGVEEIKDLEVGMILEGVVSNVVKFGAFVDIGVHQDGLVHISAMAKRYIEDPHQVVKAGDVVKVKVMEVDERRKRIGLSMRLDDQVDSRR